MGKEGRTQACQRETVRTGRGGALFLQSPYFFRGRDGVVGILTRYGLGGSGLKTRWG